MNEKIPGTNFYKLQLVAEGEIKRRRKTPKPEEGSAVLGGKSLITVATDPEPGSMVLGGLGGRLARLFDRFNSEAKAVNKDYLCLDLGGVRLLRRKKANPLDDIKIKVLVKSEKPPHPNYLGYWWFAGHLKHDGPLFAHTAKYDPSTCPEFARAIALKCFLTI